MGTVLTPEFPIREPSDIAEIRALLDAVTDPEIPVLTLNDLGVIRGIEVEHEDGARSVRITITPTYSGCPAMITMEMDIRDCLLRAGIDRVEIETVLSPAWTTDWMTENGRRKLAEYGIAPPVKGEPSGRRALFGEAPTVQCPHCGAEETKLVSEFGSTAFKSLYQCNACLEPFDYFKCI